MNTYRAMGVTGYLFKNYSTSPKILFQNFWCMAQESEQKKTGRPEGLPAVYFLDRLIVPWGRRKAVPARWRPVPQAEPEPSSELPEQSPQGRLQPEPELLVSALPEQ